MRPPERPILLLVEDNILVRIPIELELALVGFAMLTAEHGDDAMTRLETMSRDINGLITDIDLGTRVTGWDVARRARELLPLVPVRVTS